MKLKDPNNWGYMPVNQIPDVLNRVLILFQLETLLRKAWDKDGSPFQGQPFDPCVLGNISK